METPRGSCYGQFWVCWDLKVRQNHTWGERELIPEKVRKKTEYLRERAKQESIRVEWTGNSTLHTKNSCCLKPMTEKQCTCLYCGSSRRKPGTTRPCKAVLCLLGPWILLHWAQCQVVSACGRRREDGVMGSCTFPLLGNSEPLSTHTSCASSYDIKTMQQHWS